MNIYASKDLSFGTFVRVILAKQNHPNEAFSQVAADFNFGAKAGNGKRFTFPRRGFPSNVPTLIGEEPKFLLVF